MSERVTIGEASVPRLRRGVKLRFDPRRGAWVLLAPERVLMPDEIALEILRRCDGQATVAALVDELSRTFEAERALIAHDVAALLQNLADKGMIEAS
ncbi:MAG TPA: pyrroloquinoline quinone biosynthesis peptide chaperone PqqD [Geminicoccaceae bacterium]|nr:pyrroloquinoline quinone biosynthesis peptide chaperone PqqD [Geminicoccaceae bacterium]